MFEKLTYSVTFPSTGRSFAGDIDFKTGFGTITGPNEAGKSLIIEIARWCLFGTAALRGKAEDYKTLKATLSFEVRGAKYVVERTHNTAKLGDIVAGTKPVNAHICQLLGFGLDVFDIACVANQGYVEKLSSMKPTERKRMVDDVVGLTNLEDLAKWCGDEAKALERIAIPPGDEPARPDTSIISILGEGLDETTNGVLVTLLEQARAAYEELHQLNGVLSVKVAPPVEPQTLTAAGDWDVVVEKENELRAECKMLHARRDSLPQPFGYTDEELDVLEASICDYKDWLAREQFEKLHPISLHHREQLRVMRDDWAVIGQRDILSRLVAELEKHGEVDCPNCDHHFFLESYRLSELQSKLQALGEISPPPLTLAQINAEMGKLDDWALKTTLDEWKQVRDALQVDPPRVTQRDIDMWRRGNLVAQERAQIEERIIELGNIPDHRPQLQARTAYEADYKRYLEDNAWYERRMKERAPAQARVVEIAPLADMFPQLGQLQQDWSQYTDRKGVWDVASEKYTQLSDEADGWRRAQTALNNLRVMVKGHLVPALSRVASGLLHQMTGGQRNIISVDQEFDVVVDGQPLSTLSGSGKAVANLALRLGLGQVLTNNVFSVFVGDEIDASMDDTRAGNLGECIRTLACKISQIVLITHKSHGDAGWCVNLGMENE